MLHYSLIYKKDVIKTMLQKFSTFLIAILVLTSCTTNPLTGGRSLNFVGDDRARELGAQTAQAAIENEGLYHSDEHLNAYYQDLATKLKNVTDRPEEDIEFIILDSGTYNAWATPGYINTYRGILPFFNSEAELVGVMAHEIGHIKAKHVARTLTRGTLAGLLVTGVAIGVGVSTDSSATANAAVVLGSLGATVALKGYSRAFEREADALALKYMEQMGYDPRYAAHLFEGMVHHRTYSQAVYGTFNNGEALPNSPFYDLLLSHPDPQERVENVVQAKGTVDGTVRLPAGITPATPAADPTGQARYFNVIDGLAMGTKVDDGVMGKDVYYSKKLRIHWPFATAQSNGFLFRFKQQTETGKTWEGIDNTNKNKWLFIEQIESSKAYTPEEAVRTVFPNARDIEKVSAAGRTGMTGMVKNLKNINQNKHANGDTRIVVLPTYGSSETGKQTSFLVAAFVNWEEADVRASLNQMEHLSAAAAKRVEGLELDIRTIRSGDTLNSLGQKMAVGALGREYFSALNGIDENDPLITGQQVKLVKDPNFGRF